MVESDIAKLIQFIPEPRIDPPEIYGGKLDQHYRFIQYHYHWAQNDNEGSEHTLCGRYFPAELHLVHQGVEDPSKLAVLGVFLQLATAENEAGSALEVEAQALPKIKCFGQKVPVPAQELKNKLPKNQQAFVRYQGSLTTPPCSENVTWTVLTEPVTVTREQLNLLRAVEDCRGKVIHKNYRPLQPLNDRTLHYC
ncbi:eukaryotic-type carbonic anhydrase domain-containing protein [Ditylenchus destructor]|nr:eukaryotic-type carbonic anhydrase domain-containing protein [Ditylenchus destructor]